MKKGIVKWFRHDGTGYIVAIEQPHHSLYVDASVVKETKPLERGQRVKFREKTVLGRKVAFDVEVIES